MRNLLKKPPGRWILGIGLFTTILAGCSNDEAVWTLLDFEGNFDLAAVETRDAVAELVASGDKQALNIRSGHSVPGPGITLVKQGDPWNLNGYQMVKMDITNTGNSFMQVIMQVGDPEDGMEAWQMQVVVDLEPGESKTAVDYITTTPFVFKPPLELVGMRAAPGQTKTRLDSIDRIIVSVRYADEPHSFTIDNIRAEGKVEFIDPEGFLPFIDKFGQVNHRDWPGKTHSEEDLKKAIDEEKQELEQFPGPEDFNEYGGWKTGPRFEPTGFFQTAKYRGSWWLVDPEGCLFWSHGACCVHPGSARTGITGREAYFEALPPKDSPFGEFYGRSRYAAHQYYKNIASYETYNFTGANLYRKYGGDWKEEFNRSAHARLRSWGMNTLAIASDRQLCLEDKTPYVATVWVRNTRKIEASSGYWGKFHDVFDPSFREAVRRSISQRQEEAEDPWCFGFFIENELSWGRDGSLSVATLESPPEQIAKQVFVNDLRGKYGQISALNDAWGTSHESWRDLLQCEEAPDMENARVDLMEFYQKIATTYFSTVKEEMDRVAPNTLYLGCRLAWANSDIVIGTAAEYCDVISFNKYEYSVADFSLPEGVDKPVIIGEFHFGALDRGAYHVGIKRARDQEHRGELYQAYVQGALRNPLIVGTHWFQYGDQAPTGRSDGENYNVGLVDICDHPFPEVVAKIRETGYGLYHYRMKYSENPEKN
jgi:hypothetical protein